jgi:type IV secretory pathway VirJ component
MAATVRSTMRDRLARFMERLQALFDTMAQAEASKARSDAALAALNIGNDAKAAFAEAGRKRADATALCGQAESVLKQAHVDAAEFVERAKAEAAAIVAEAQKIHDGATAAKADVDAAIAAANAERRQLQTNARQPAGWGRRPRTQSRGLRRSLRSCVPASKCCSMSSGPLPNMSRQCAPLIDVLRFLTV